MNKWPKTHVAMHPNEQVGKFLTFKSRTDLASCHSINPEALTINVFTAVINSIPQ
jgi:hypothetical protein